MNSGKKIAAFTMVDVLTGVVITSIIIGMVFYLFTSLNKQVADYGETRNQLNRYLLLKTDLKRQFDKNEQIKAVPFGFELGAGAELVSYQPSESSFIRATSNAIDTLSDQLDKLEIELIPVPEEKEMELVRSVDITVDVNGQKLTSHFQKDFGIVATINKTLLHEF